MTQTKPYDVMSLLLYALNVAYRKSRIGINIWQLGINAMLEYRIGRPTHFEIVDVIHGSYYVRYENYDDNQVYPYPYRIGRPSYVLLDNTSTAYEVIYNTYWVIPVWEVIICDVVKSGGPTY